MRDASYGMLVGIAIALGLAGSLIIVLATEVFYRLYEGTVKGCVERSAAEAKEFSRERKALIPNQIELENEEGAPLAPEDKKTEEEAPGDENVLDDAS